MKRILLLLILCFFMLSGCGDAGYPMEGDDTFSSAAAEEPGGSEEAGKVAEEGAVTEVATAAIDENGVYTSKDDVALYIHTYGHLPDNFITKKEAKKLGWPGGSLDEYAEGKCIGGDHFSNYEGTLPEKPGREYRECDIDTLHAAKRGPKRLVYSNDGLIYYTPDHYDSFELLYDDG
jgi:guanyl-specific ribonuclease Sa